MTKTKNKITYISGPISDADKLTQNCNLARFFTVEKILLDRGYNVHNPARFEGDRTAMEWCDYMAIDMLFIVRNKPNMYMLSGWEDSMGAKLEHSLANLMELEIEYETDS